MAFRCSVDGREWRWSESERESLEPGERQLFVCRSHVHLAPRLQSPAQQAYDDQLLHSRFDSIRWTKLYALDRSHKCHHDAYCSDPLPTSDDLVGTSHRLHDQMSVRFGEFMIEASQHPRTCLLGLSGGAKMSLLAKLRSISAEMDVGAACTSLSIIRLATTRSINDFLLIC